MGWFLPCFRGLAIDLIVVLETSLAGQGLSYNFKEGKMFFSAIGIIAQIQAYMGKIQEQTFSLEGKTVSRIKPQGKK